MDLSTVSRWHSIFEVAGIVFLGLLVLSEVAAYRLGHIKEQLVDKQHEMEMTPLRARHLTADQVATLRRVLVAAVPGKVFIQSKMLDSEAEAYADQFADVLRASGWQVQRAMTGLGSVGVLVGARDPRNAPPCATVLLHALQAIGLQPGPAHVDDLDPTFASLHVFGKPPQQ